MQERFFTSSLPQIVFGPGNYGVLVVVLEVTEQVTSSRRRAWELVLICTDTGGGMGGGGPNRPLRT